MNGSMVSFTLFRLLMHGKWDIFLNQSYANDVVVPKADYMFNLLVKSVPVEPAEELDQFPWLNIIEQMHD